MNGDFSKATSSYDATQPFGGIATGLSATPAPTPTPTFNNSTNPSGGLYQYNAANNSYSTKPASGGNDSSLTNSYLSALKNQQGATATAQSLSGYTAPDPNKPPSALPQWTPEQHQQFQTMFSSLFGLPAGQSPTGQPTNPATGQPVNPPTGLSAAKPPEMVAGDNSRFVNDPFKTNANALR